MRNHLLSIGVGVGLVVAGLMLWLLAQDVITPLVSLSKVGLVLAVLGAVEVLVSGTALLLRPTRHRDEPL